MDPTAADCGGVSPEPRTPDDGFQSMLSNLRGIRWRIDLGVLPSSPTTSIDDLRRITANSRRRYANLRRRLLIDSHLPRNGSTDTSPDHSIDNPLSRNPDSTWGRYFKNAELEKMVDQDLSRLYPKDNSFFQTPMCQAMLRRILLLWCLRNPQYGYRQGMHELLAPLLYVLHVDVKHPSKVQEAHEDYFNYDFDKIPFSNGDLLTNYRFTKPENCSTDSLSGNGGSEISGSKPRPPFTPEELDHETRDIFMLSDAYGVEGELGAILSERFAEHDAYCMFDCLMSGGAHGVVAMAEFFSPLSSTNAGPPPVIEASSSLYHLLAVVDSSLHAHLVELGVEPQYFALRWLRLLFGREFSLEDILVIWDEIFSAVNTRAVGDDGLDYSFKMFCSPRGAFISSMAVSMLLHLRYSLLSTEYSTSCLQKLLNFPENVDLEKLIERAKALQVLAYKANLQLSQSPEVYSGEKRRVKSRAFQSLPESFWEEKWRVMHLNLASHGKGSSDHSVSGGEMRGCSSRTEVSTSASENAVEIGTHLVGSGDPKVEGLAEDLAILKVSMDLHDKEKNSDRVRIESSFMLIKKRTCSCQNKFEKLRIRGCEKCGGEEAGGGCFKEAQESSTDAKISQNTSKCSSSDDHCMTSAQSGDPKYVKSYMLSTLKSLSKSMLENVQVIESALQSDQGEAPMVVGAGDLFSNVLGDENGHQTAMEALKELRKISNLLSEM